MKSDIQIAREAKKLYIGEIAKKANISDEALILYGNDKAKVDITKIDSNKKGKLVLVTAINPTKAGEGKSTTTVGLVDSLNNIGVNTIGCLREPSLGPVFGIKGGAAGGGYSQVIPMEDINLHFTGDMHAITSANNLISACIDNHIFHGNELNLNPDNIIFTRVMDMNDRNLRHIGLGGFKQGVSRTDRFQITVASEIMAILCLSLDMEDFRRRIDNILIGFDYDENPVLMSQFNITGSICVLMRDCLKPNLVQTIENNPILIHGGPFANIAHGCNSLIATKLGLKLADVVVTEAGFGADLGAEKFLNIKSRIGDLKPDLVCIVATIRALKLQGNASADNLAVEDLKALELGICNLEKHIDSIEQFNVKPLVVINHFATDTEEEINLLKSKIESLGIDVVLSKTFALGSEGGVEFAKLVKKNLDNSNDFKHLYDLDLTIREKVNQVATKIYGATDVIYSEQAETKLKLYEEKFDMNIPICIAKTPNSLSGDPKLLGRPTDFSIHVDDVKLQNGAEFMVIYVGGVMTMPGLAKVPNATRIDIDKNGNIQNLS